jgi:hypothetical protein
VEGRAGAVKPAALTLRDRLRARHERGRVEEALARAGWPWSIPAMSRWLDELWHVEERAT